MNNQNVRQVEMSFVMTHALRQCRRKLFKKGGASYGSDKLSNDENDQFQNCIGKYLDVATYSEDGMREGLLQSLKWAIW